MKYRHYAPNIPVLLVEEFASQDLDDENILCLVTSDYDAGKFNLIKVNEQNLFSIFRGAEKDKKAKILILNSDELFKKAGLWNRIEKAVQN